MNTLNVEQFGNWWAREQERIRIQKRKDTLLAIALGLVFSGTSVAMAILEAV